MKLISPSRLVCESSGLTPTGTETMVQDGRCYLCTDEIKAGDPCSSFQGGKTFADNPQLGCPESQYICGYCSAITAPGAVGMSYMQKNAKGVYSKKDGVFMLASNLDQHHWLMNPPKPPFLMCIGQATMQHMIWHSPVSYSRDYFFVRLGRETLSIRRKKVLAVLKKCKKIREDCPKGLLFKPLYTLSEPDGGAVLHQALAEEFTDISRGEIWAVSKIQAVKEKDVLKYSPRFLLS